ncbi:MAG: response regulator transcription factor [Gammaproteobacteria bacterium]|nr:response regulator transcription factor [Gammaproteobacteria bacterium]
MNIRPRLLWVDLTVSVKHADISSAIRGSCDVEICSDASRLSEAVEENSIDCICFDIDYPDHGSLNLLRKTKMRHPGMPILLLTLQHSESLAVWAFRTRVLDFLVKPVSHGDFHHFLQTLRYVTKVSVNQRSRTQGDNIAPIPPEVPLTMRTDDVRLLPALYYVKQNFRCKIRSEVVSELCDMSPFRFSRSFRETYGVTFQDYLMRYRILESCRLLHRPHSNITDVAYAVGFNDASYFSRTFRRYVGMTPSDYCAVCEDETASASDPNFLRAILNIPDDKSVFGSMRISK